MYKKLNEFDKNIIISLLKVEIVKNIELENITDIQTEKDTYLSDIAMYKDIIEKIRNI